MKTPPKPIAIPSEAEAAAMTDRLVEIKKQIEDLTKEKKALEERLETFAALQQHEPLKDENREGRRVVLCGTRHRLPVVFSSDLLIKSFKEGSPKHTELLGLLTPEGGLATEELRKQQAETLLRKFFAPPATWEALYDDGLQFRAVAAEWLPTDLAPRFITACVQRDKYKVAKSTTTFDFKAVQPAVLGGAA